METIKENPLYVYKPTIFKHHGPSFPGFDDILKKYVAFKIYFFFFKYRNINKCFQKKKRYAPYLMINPSQIACGFPPHTPVQRIMHDSFSDLYLSVKGYPPQ